MKEKIHKRTKKQEPVKHNVSQVANSTHVSFNNFPIRKIMSLQQTLGNQAVQRLFKSGFIQGKLTICQPHDKYEEEADRVANEVVSMPKSSDNQDVLTQTKLLSRQITLLVQTKSDSQTPRVFPGLESKINSLKDGGQPLSQETRCFFEPRFGKDFSKVRVHTDSDANQLARSINARAFTRGNDIVFGNGEYQPESLRGKRLLGHELTHVVQQNSGQFFPNIMIQRTPLCRRQISFTSLPKSLKRILIKSYPDRKSIRCDILLELYDKFNETGIWRYIKKVKNTWGKGAKFQVMKGKVKGKTLETYLYYNKKMCLDSGIGNLLHQDATSYREISSYSSLHISIRGNELSAHIDQISPVKSRDKFGKCIFDPIRSQAHLGREVIPLYFPSWLPLQIFPEFSIHQFHKYFSLDPTIQTNPSIVGITFHFDLTKSLHSGK